MKRIDGYLVIDDYEYVVLDNGRRRCSTCIEGELYYFKETDKMYEEVIGYNILKFLGIDACYNDLAILDGKCGIISKALINNKGKLISGSELLGDYLANNFDTVSDMGFVGELANSVKKYGLGDTMRYFSSFYVNNLEVIRGALEDRYKDNIDINSVMNEFIVMYIITIIFADIDKNPNNWFIIENDSKIRLAPIFDNGEMFDYYYDECEIDEVFGSFSVSFEDSNLNQMESLKVFFNTYGYDYFCLFNDIFNKVMLNFDEILKMCEIQIGCDIPAENRERLIVAFNSHCERIQSVIDDYRRKR